MGVGLFLSIIAHGTDGSDGIDPGVHLRWVFNHKLGFPPEGFRLRRRASTRRLQCIDLSKVAPRRFPFPSPSRNTAGSRRPSNTVTSVLRPGLATARLGRFSPIGRQKILMINGSMDFHLSSKMNRIEIEYYETRGMYFTLNALSDDKVIWKKTIKRRGLVKLKKLAIDTLGADVLRVNGKNIKIKKICYWVCKPADWGLVDEDCGYGLPYKQTGHFSDECDPDWAVAACRLGADKKICRFKGKNFEDFKAVLSEMEDDGTKAPVGWKLMTLRDEVPSPDESETDSPVLHISPYDILLMQSQNPDIAKILGLYWIDKTAGNSFYDYKITAEWPAHTLCKLGHELAFDDLPVGRAGLFQFSSFLHEYLRLSSFYQDSSLVTVGKLVFQGKKPTVVESQSSIARVEHGLAFDYPNDTEIRIQFDETVREVQIFLSQLGFKTDISAFIDDSRTPVDGNHLTAREGVLSVHAQSPIKQVRIQGKGITIYRIHYDEEYLPYGDGEQEFILCGVKKGKPEPLQAPTGLKANCIRGGIPQIEENGTLADNRFTVGLRWNLPLQADTGLLPGSPTSYHVKRTNPRNEETLVTEDSPVHITNQDTALESPSEQVEQPVEITGCDGEILGARPYFFDAVDEKGVCKYQVAAMDLFGRISPYSPTAEVLLTPPLPPPPADVHAKFLDYSTYDSQSDSFSDPNLNLAEQQWLKANRKSASVVHWNWNKQLQQQAPDARGFRVYLNHGWLNSLQGIIVGVREIANGFEVDTDIKQNISVNSLVDEWLRQGKIIFRINKNSASSANGTALSFVVDAPPAYLELPPDEAKPRTDVPFVLPVMKLGRLGGAAIDYTAPANWISLGEQGDVTIVVPSQTAYEIYIPEPPFPNPPFGTGNGYEQHKTRYAQIGVGTYSEEGEGSMSPPSAIIAVDRRKPPAQVFEDSPGLKATPADYYGKSAYPLRWTKSQDPGIRYYVYRAMDETVFRIDWSLRPRSPLTVAHGGFPSGWSDGQKQQVCDELNRLDEFTTDNDGKKQAERYYRNLSNDAMRVLANLEGLEAAFAKLNDKPIAQSASEFQDRDTDIPTPSSAPWPGNPQKLLYVDNTLDGRGDNKYFYRIRAIDEIGNLGAFGPVTLPVEIPKVTPPQAPVITQVSGGDRQITIRWAKNPGAGIKGYLLYRADDEEKAKDVRRMKLIKKNAEDVYSLEMLEPLPNDFKYEYEDKEVEARKKYFYGLVAVTEGDNARNLYSQISVITVGQAYDLTPPEPPTWEDLSRELINQNERIVLKWFSSEQVSCLIKKREKGAGTFIAITAWLDVGSYNEADGRWEYMLVDKNVKHNKTYTYQIKVRNTSGNIALSHDSIEI